LHSKKTAFLSFFIQEQNKLHENRNGGKIQKKSFCVKDARKSTNIDSQARKKLTDLDQKRLL
jgi:hypothetical protein